VYFGNMKNYASLLILLITITSCQHSQLEVSLGAKSGSNAAGFALLSEKGGVVSLSATIRGLSEGTHAIHLHEKADCSSDDGKSSGGHWNPTFEPHGAWGDEKGYHKGDIGNFEVGKNGVGRVYFETDKWCIGCEDDTKNILGKAIIVHQGADDFVSQPSGAAGRTHQLCWNSRITIFWVLAQLIQKSVKSILLLIFQDQIS
jgi:Cu-Zn family superoxide dismutase